MSLPNSLRLTFRLWTPADLPLAQSLWGDPEIALYLGGPFTPEDIRDKLQVELDRQQTYGHQYWPIFLRETGEFAGCAGLRPFHDHPNVRELGVHIARPFWSARLGEEAARAVIHHAFDHLHLQALTAGHNPANTYSQALLQRLGFLYTHHEPWGPFNLQHPFYRLDHAPSTNIRQAKPEDHAGSKQALQTSHPRSLRGGGPHLRNLRPNPIRRLRRQPPRRHRLASPLRPAPLR